MIKPLGVVEFIFYQRHGSMDEKGQGETPALNVWQHYLIDKPEGTVVPDGLVR